MFEQDKNMIREKIGRMLVIMISAVAFSENLSYASYQSSSGSYEKQLYEQMHADQNVSLDEFKDLFERYAAGVTNQQEKLNIPLIEEVIRYLSLRTEQRDSCYGIISNTLFQVASKEGSTFKTTFDLMHAITCTPSGVEYEFLTESRKAFEDAALNYVDAILRSTVENHFSLSESRSRAGHILQLSFVEFSFRASVLKAKWIISDNRLDVQEEGLEQLINELLEQVADNENRLYFES